MFGQAHDPLVARDVRSDVVHDITSVMDRFAHDRFWAVTYWDAYRDKSAMLDICDSRWTQWSADELLTLAGDELRAVYAFYDTLARFRLWVRHTEAMPATLEVRYDAAHEALAPMAHKALQMLGPVPERPAAVVLPDWGDLRR